MRDFYVIAAFGGGRKACLRGRLAFEHLGRPRRVLQPSPAPLERGTRLLTLA